METLFLWLVVCLDGAPCTNSQVYRIDSFTGVAADDDCTREMGRLTFNLVNVANVPGQRVGCKTLAQFEREGLTHGE